MTRNKEYENLIEKYVKENAEKVFREPNGYLKHRYLVPGSVYSQSLWDWDSWLTDMAVAGVASADNLIDYEKGCILNFLEYMDELGRLPVFISPTVMQPEFDKKNEKNIHKPCLVQHALFISERAEDFEWLRNIFGKIKRFIGFYMKYCRHENGLYFWLDDSATGVDNDPCVFYRPNKSSANIYLNSLMYRELLAMSEISAKLGFEDLRNKYKEEADNLKSAMQTLLWDERNGFYYSADLNLRPIDPNAGLHRGYPRHWSSVIQKTDVWTGFMAMWSGVATAEQAERMVKENYLDKRTFNSPYGIRTLSKLEQMYLIVKSGNPSCWLGPIWGISNYMTFEGLLNYGYIDEARELAIKTVNLFGRDVKENGEFHEYYDPETGEGVNNPGFQSWNLLVLNVVEWLRKNG